VPGAPTLRVLFFVDRPGVLRQFSVVLQELAARGHEVRVALRDEPDAHRRRAVEAIVGTSPNLSYGLAPRRDPQDGWTPVAWVVRALGDLARYTHPRYAAAPVLRARMTKKTLGRLRSRQLLDPVAQALALKLGERLAATSDAGLSERTIRRAARLEAAIPPSEEITRAIREQQPDVVLVTSVVKSASAQVEYLKSARAAGVPSGSCVASWDNLTNKGLLKFVPERVFVWNEVMRREAVELHGIPRERVVATGAALFDPWFGRQPSGPRETFVRAASLDPDRPYVLFLGSSPFVTHHGEVEVRFVERWIDALRASGDERVRGIGVMVRPHPIGKGWKGADLARFGNAVIWPPHSERPIAAQDQADFFDSLAHSAVVVGINTTAMIEAAIAGKSVLTVLAPEFAQETTLHFHYLLEENGGFLHVASSLEEHAAQLGRVLDEDAADAERRLRFVESFVRPHGLDRAAAPVFADAVEELAAVPVQGAPSAGLLLRAPLALEAALLRRVRRDADE